MFLPQSMVPHVTEKSTTNKSVRPADRKTSGLYRSCSATSYLTAFAESKFARSKLDLAFVNCVTSFEGAYIHKMTNLSLSAERTRASLRYSKQGRDKSKDILANGFGVRRLLVALERLWYSPCDELAPTPRGFSAPLFAIRYLKSGATTSS